MMFEVVMSIFYIRVIKNMIQSFDHGKIISSFVTLSTSLGSQEGKRGNLNF